jgi:3-deoxy-D-arabino-heptulosonate 7-phosphate (DAHP) synthase
MTVSANGSSVRTGHGGKVLVRDVNENDYYLIAHGLRNGRSLLLDLKQRGVTLIVPASQTAPEDAETVLEVLPAS